MKLFQYFNFDKIKTIQTYDDLFLYYFKKYKIDYLYYCYLNNHLLSTTELLILSRYTKQLLFGDLQKDIVIFYNFHIITNEYIKYLLHNNPYVIVNNKCKQIITIDLKEKKYTFIKFIESLLETKDIYTSVTLMEYYSKLIEYLQNEIIDHSKRVKIYSYLFTQNFKVMNEIIETNYNNLWFNETTNNNKAISTILGDILNQTTRNFNYNNHSIINIFLHIISNGLEKYVLQWFIDTYNQFKNVKTINYDFFVNVSIIIHRLFFIFQQKWNTKLRITNLVIELSKEYEKEYIVNSLFNLSILYLDKSLILLINDEKYYNTVKLNLEKIIQEHTVQNNSNVFIQHTFVAIQKKALDKIESKLTIIKNLINLFYNLNSSLPILLNNVITCLLKKTNKNKCMTIIENVLLILKNKLLFTNFQSILNIYNILQLINKMNTDKDIINSHIKSSLSTITYNLRIPIVNLCLIDETQYTQLINNCFSNYIEFHNLNKSWSFYEKMYNKLDILSFLIYYYDNCKKKIEYTSIDFLKKTCYIIFEDLIELNDKLYASLENIEEIIDIDTTNKESVNLLFEKNKIFFNLIEINLEFILTLLNINNETLIEELFDSLIIKQFTLGLHYLLDKNIVYKFSNYFPKLELFLKLKQYTFIYDIIISIICHPKITQQTEYINLTYKQKYFSEDNLKLIVGDYTENKTYTQNKIKCILLLNKINQINTPIIKELKYPKEFYDPIMFSVIQTPIYLPDSKMVVEKNIIEEYLLTSNEDPFTRSPLTQKTLLEYNQQNDIICKQQEFLQRKKEFEIKNQ